MASRWRYRSGFRDLPFLCELCQLLSVYPHHPRQDPDPGCSSPEHWRCSCHSCNTWIIHQWTENNNINVCFVYFVAIFSKPLASLYCFSFFWHTLFGTNVVWFFLERFKFFGQIFLLYLNNNCSWERSIEKSVILSRDKDFLLPENIQKTQKDTTYWKCEVRLTSANTSVMLKRSGTSSCLWTGTYSFPGGQCFLCAGFHWNSGLVWRRFPSCPSAPCRSRSQRCGRPP